MKTSTLPRHESPAGDVNQLSQTNTASNANESVSSEEYGLEKLVNHGFVDDGGISFEVKGFEIPSEENTWEPVSHLPRYRIVRYCRRKRISLPVNLENAQVGKILFTRLASTREGRTPCSTRRLRGADAEIPLGQLTFLRIRSHLRVLLPQDRCLNAIEKSVTRH